MSHKKKEMIFVINTAGFKTMHVRYVFKYSEVASLPQDNVVPSFFHRNIRCQIDPRDGLGHLLVPANHPIYRGGNQPLTHWSSKAYPTSRLGRTPIVLIKITTEDVRKITWMA